MKKLLQMIPWTIERKKKTKEEQQLEDIKDILFPKLELAQEQTQDGMVTKYHIDRSLVGNLDSALMDLQEGYNDVNTHETINHVITELEKIRKILGAYNSIDKEAKYIFVDYQKDNKEIDQYKEI